MYIFFHCSFDVFKTLMYWIGLIPKYFVFLLCNKNFEVGTFLVDQLLFYFYFMLYSLYGLKFLKYISCWSTVLLFFFYDFFFVRIEIFQVYFPLPQSLEKYCRSEAGYSGIQNVYNENSIKDDVQQSFLFAELFKVMSRNSFFFHRLYTPLWGMDGLVAKFELVKKKIQACVF